jgi:hypothetical protein
MRPFKLPESHEMVNIQSRNGTSDFDERNIDEVRAEAHWYGSGTGVHGLQNYIFVLLHI